MARNLHHICIHIKNFKSAKKKKKKKKKKIQNIYRFKMAANVLISTSQKRSCDQNLKNHIPKEKVGR